MSKARLILLVLFVGASNATAVPAGLVAVQPSGGQPAGSGSAACIVCDSNVTRRIVADWRLSKHSQQGVVYQVCHGDQHQTVADHASARIPTPDACGPCHPAQVERFKKEKSAMAWVGMKVMPTFHYQPMAMTKAMKGCGCCHKIGLKSPATVAELRREGNNFGIASFAASSPQIARHASRPILSNAGYGNAPAKGARADYPTRFADFRQQNRPLTNIEALTSASVNSDEIELANCHEFAGTNSFHQLVPLRLAQCYGVFTFADPDVVSEDLDCRTFTARRA